jgi:hypothetical protein
MACDGAGSNGPHGARKAFSSPAVTRAMLGLVGQVNLDVVGRQSVGFVGAGPVLEAAKQGEHPGAGLERVVANEARDRLDLRKKTRG